MSKKVVSAETNMPILAHLAELRTRLMWALVALVVGSVLAALFTRYLLAFLTEPYCQHLVLPDDATCAQLVTLRPTEAIETYFRIALTAGAIGAMPAILWQIWLFIRPALQPQERRYVYIFLPAGTLLFLTGVLFAWYVLMPPALYFLVNFLSQSINNQWQLAPYIDFVTGFLFWIGVSFQMPLIVWFLARFGLLTPQTMREQWRYAIVGIAVLAAIITPSVDPVTMLLTMAPLTALYLFSIGMAWLGARQFGRIGEEPA
jgi:sec-independent protein translocase protein TatC